MESGCACRNEKSEGTSRAAHVGFHFCEAIPNENVGLPSIYLTKAKFPVAAQYARKAKTAECAATLMRPLRRFFCSCAARHVSNFPSPDAEDDDCP